MCSSDLNPHVNGSVIAEAVPDNKEAAKLVDKLHKEPSDSVSRLQLVNTVMGASSAHSLATNRDMMLQAAIPIYLGDVTQTYLMVVVHAYKNYHEKLMNLHKQKSVRVLKTIDDESLREELGLPPPPSSSLRPGKSMWVR